MDKYYCPKPLIEKLSEMIDKFDYGYIVRKTWGHHHITWVVREQNSSNVNKTIWDVGNWTAKNCMDFIRRKVWVEITKKQANSILKYWYKQEKNKCT